MRAHADPRRAAVNRGYFKTGPGEYGEGDVFVGLDVPTTRTLARQFRELPLPAVSSLISSRVHEERVLGLMLLAGCYGRATASERERLFRFYVRHFPFINNWDLVDGSAPAIAGAHLDGRSKVLLFEWARSPRLWDRRIAVLATQPWIRKGRFVETFRLARLLLRDPEDLMHKAVGWMLREIDHRDRPALVRFLERHGARMPRTMLRYAIERFPELERRRFLGLGRSARLL
ncbi:MAG: DNA alkylation repair protein [Planctomycetes bacterium]|nr:DNA alkylation repair protein [Planctomycetota bacterium]